MLQLIPILGVVCFDDFVVVKNEEILWVFLLLLICVGVKFVRIQVVWEVGFILQFICGEGELTNELLRSSVVVVL
jgi:hypothetical protein